MLLLDFTNNDLVKILTFRLSNSTNIFKVLTFSSSGPFAYRGAFNTLHLIHLNTIIVSHRAKFQQLKILAPLQKLLQMPMV